MLSVHAKQLVKYLNALFLDGPKAWRYRGVVTGRPRLSDKERKTRQVRVLLTERDYARVADAARRDHASELAPWLATLALRRADRLGVPVSAPEPEAPSEPAKPRQPARHRGAE